MSKVLAIIAALNALGVHGTKEKCQELVVSLSEVSKLDARICINPKYSDNESIHFDEDMDAIVKFRDECYKGNKKR